MAQLKRLQDRETLARIKRWPHLISRFPKVRIYSAEHAAYWRGAGHGYTHNPLESHVLTCEQAVRKTQHCDDAKGIQFVQVNAIRDQRDAMADALATIEKTSSDPTIQRLAREGLRAHFEHPAA